ncbi:hypothetical protein CR513_33057, partial [Mucuna pruriens]
MPPTQVLHSRYGHLSYSGLKTLLEHDMVKGLPTFKSPTQLCEHCLKGKHQKDPDICGPINPTSNGNKRSPTLAVKNITSKEAWSGMKPSVSYFRIFGCIGFVHVPNKKRSKLDDKSTKCVLFGVSEESKAYKIYDPINEKIHISRYVKFQDTAWDWGEAKTSRTLDANELNLIEESYQAAEEVIQTNLNDAAATTSTIVPNSTSNLSNLSLRGAKVPTEGRTRKPPAWMKDYVTRDDLTYKDAINFAMFAGADPVTYYQA